MNLFCLQGILDSSMNEIQLNVTNRSNVIVLHKILLVAENRIISGLCPVFKTLNEEDNVQAYIYNGFPDCNITKPFQNMLMQECLISPYKVRKLKIKRLLSKYFGLIILDTDTE